MEVQESDAHTQIHVNVYCWRGGGAQRELTEHLTVEREKEFLQCLTHSSSFVLFGSSLPDHSFLLLSPPEVSMTTGFETSGVSFPALADLASYPVHGQNHFSRCADRNQLLRETAHNELHRFPQQVNTSLEMDFLEFHVVFTAGISKPHADEG